jgi:DNA-binding LacI/PurR family transcriptional regulator
MPIDLHDRAPLYVQIVEDVKSKIASKKLKADDRLGSQSELAEFYGVSLITVKKALATMIHGGILYSRVGKGTYVARTPLEERPRERQTIGLVLRDIQSPFFSRVMHSVEDAAYERGYHVLISSSSGSKVREEAQIARLRKFGVSGMIVASMSHKYHATPTVRRMLHEGFPFVMVSYVADEDIPFVGSDHELGGYLATNYLIKLGFQRIGYINGERGNLVGDLRQRGYERALIHDGRRTKKELIFHLRFRGERHDYQSGYEIGKKLLKMRVKPDAVFVYNDLSALGFEDAILDQGLKVPEDVGVVGFDDIERGQYARVPLTTVRQPTALIGRRAVELLLKLMGGKTVTTRIILKPELVIRDSCGDHKKKGLTNSGRRVQD